MNVVGVPTSSTAPSSKPSTGLDDHSRFCVYAHLVLRATSRPTCHALEGAARRRHDRRRPRPSHPLLAPAGGRCCSTASAPTTASAMS